MKYAILATSFLLLALGSVAQNYDAISSAFGRGSAGDLSAFFGTTIELTLEGDSYELDRNRAQEKIRTFFKESEPSQFKIVHKGVSPSDLHYCIGQLSAKTGTYRVTLYLKKTGDAHLIQSLELEKE